MSAPTEALRLKAVLVGVQLSGVTDAEQRSSLKELKRLCETLGFEVVRPDLADMRLAAHGRIITTPPACAADRSRAGGGDRRQVCCT